MRDLARAIAEQAELAGKSFYRLVVVAGLPGSGKTRALNELKLINAWNLVNLNGTLSERLLELTTNQRRRHAAGMLRDLSEEQGNLTVTMLDNIGLLFHPSLEQNPLKTLQLASRNRTLIAAWQGEFTAGKLIYAMPDHPEYRRIDARDVLVVSVNSPSFGGA